MPKNLSPHHESNLWGSARTEFKQANCLRDKERPSPQKPDVDSPTLRSKLVAQLQRDSTPQKSTQTYARKGFRPPEELREGENRQKVFGLKMKLKFVIFGRTFTFRGLFHPCFLDSMLLPRRVE